MLFRSASGFVRGRERRSRSVEGKARRGVVMSYDPEVISLSGSSGDDVLHGISAKLLQQAHKRIALIGCFRPRKCGIATFTAAVYDTSNAGSEERGVGKECVSTCRSRG